MPAGHLHRRLMAAPQTFVQLAYSLGASSHWPLDDAAAAVTTTIGTVREVLGGTTGTKDNLTTAETATVYWEEQRVSIAGDGSKASALMYPGDASVQSTLGKVLLRGNLSSYPTTLLCWFKVFTFTFGDAGSATFLLLNVVTDAGGPSVECYRTLNSNAGTIDGVAWTNDGAPHLITVTVAQEGGNHRYITYLDGVQKSSRTTPGTPTAWTYAEIDMDFYNFRGYGYNNGSVPFPVTTYQHAMVFDGVALSAPQLLALYNAGKP